MGGFLTRKSASWGQPPQDAIQMMVKHSLAGQGLPLRFKLALHHTELREHSIPIHLQPADIVVR